VRRHAQAYIMLLLSTQLFGDKTVARVSLRWLPFVDPWAIQLGFRHVGLAVPECLPSLKQECGCHCRATAVIAELDILEVSQPQTIRVRSV
ncbi:hypothetical protein PIB30_110945, partial [Stylosanthes scabra]|nr:hypothetical protein [Stylosanthes scabra]